MTPFAANTDHLFQLALAAGVGLLVGFEREWKQESEGVRHSFAGARTFTLTAMAGCLAGYGFTPPAVAASVFVAIAALAIAAHLVEVRESDSRGGTTEVALMVVFLLGFAAARGEALIAIAGGVATAVLLSIKGRVESIARALTAREVHAALRFLAVSALVLPVLPDRQFGPYEAFNPRDIWLMVVFISGLSFVGYWLVKAFGAASGSLITGLIGGLASSTAATLSLARQAKASGAAGSLAAGVVAANLMMVVRLSIVLGAIAPTILGRVWPAFLAAGLAGAVGAFLLNRRETASRAAGDEMRLGNPFELVPALSFAALLAVVLFISKVVVAEAGVRALIPLAIASGFADVDAITLAAAEQAATDLDIAALAVLAAAAANMTSKAVIAGMAGGRRLGLMTASTFAAMGVAAALVFISTTLAAGS